MKGLLGEAWRALWYRSSASAFRSRISRTAPDSMSAASNPGASAMALS